MLYQYHVPPVSTGLMFCGSIYVGVSCCALIVATMLIPDVIGRIVCGAGAIGILLMSLDVCVRPSMYACVQVQRKEAGERQDRQEEKQEHKECETVVVL
jgi:hypothetical protein